MYSYAFLCSESQPFLLTRLYCYGLVDLWAFIGVMMWLRIPIFSFIIIRIIFKGERCLVLLLMINFRYTAHESYLCFLYACRRYHSRLRSRPTTSLVLKFPWGPLLFNDGLQSFLLSNQGLLHRVKGLTNGG